MNVAQSGLRVMVATRPVDFRKGHDGLAAVVEHERNLHIRPALKRGSSSSGVRRGRGLAVPARTEGDFPALHGGAVHDGRAPLQAAGNIRGK